MGMLLAMMGSSGARVTLDNQAVIDTTGSAAAISYNSDGSIEETTPLGGMQPLGEWLVPATLAPGAYEIRATLNSGSVFGTTGAWTALSSGDQSWSVGAGGAADLTIEIRYGGVVQGSCNVTLDANP